MYREIAVAIFAGYSFLPRVSEIIVSERYAARPRNPLRFSPGVARAQRGKAGDHTELRNREREVFFFSDGACTTLFFGGWCLRENSPPRLAHGEVCTRVCPSCEINVDACANSTPCDYSVRRERITAFTALRLFYLDIPRYIYI